MKSFREYLAEADPRKPGKRIGGSTYVHKNYVGQSTIPRDVLDTATRSLHKNHPGFEHNIVKHNSGTGSVTFLHSPDWDDAHEPQIKHSVTVKADGTTRFNKPRKDPQIYHQKWAFVGDDYHGFDVERSKQRTKQYGRAVEQVKRATGDSKVSSKIGSKSYWDTHIAPHIEDK